MRQARAVSQAPLGAVPGRRRFARLWGIVPIGAAVALLFVPARLHTASRSRRGSSMAGSARCAP